MFILANKNRTFIIAELKSGTITILAGGGAGPFPDSEMTDVLEQKIKRGTVTKIDVENHKPPVKTKSRSAEKEEIKNIEITEDDDEL